MKQKVFLYSLGLRAVLKRQGELILRRENQTLHRSSPLLRTRSPHCNHIINFQKSIGLLALARAAQHNAARLCENKRRLLSLRFTWLFKS
jgi:hypothetical protein